MSLAVDKEGFLLDIHSWNERAAEQLAGAEGIQLTAAHWEIIWLLRDFYAETEVAPAMRALVKLVRQRLSEDKGNSIYLLSLFPDSPAKLAAKVAGLPRPPNCL